MIRWMIFRREIDSEIGHTIMEQYALGLRFKNFTDVRFTEIRKKLDTYV